jgi:hypothetical protein
LIQKIQLIHAIEKNYNFKVKKPSKTSYLGFKMDKEMDRSASVYQFGAGGAMFSLVILFAPAIIQIAV